MTSSSVWHALARELAEHQDRSPAPFRGPLFPAYGGEPLASVDREATPCWVFNPVCGFDTVFDTACAAKVFAVEHRRTGQKEWRERAEAALRSLPLDDLRRGVPEPRWDPVGWHLEAGSLSVTATVLDAARDGAALADLEPPGATQVEDLVAYLKGCEHRTGKFAHNTRFGEPDPADVQNTNAFAWFLLAQAERSGSGGSWVESRLRAVPEHLERGQRSDGFWPYLYPDFAQRLLFESGLLRPVLANQYVRHLIFRGDSSILYGDIAHHCYILYYIARALSLADGGAADPRTSMLKEGWSWLAERIVAGERDGHRLDFSAEPGPRRVRFCNFYDTTAYFLVLGVLPRLEALGVCDAELTVELGRSLLRHVERSLLVETEEPIVRPHECSIGERIKILPAVWSGIAAKGAYLADYVLHEMRARGRAGER